MTSPITSTETAKGQKPVDMTTPSFSCNLGIKSAKSMKNAYLINLISGASLTIKKIGRANQKLTKRNHHSMTLPGSKEERT